MGQQIGNFGRNVSLQRAFFYSISFLLCYNDGMAVPVLAPKNEKER